MVRITSLLIIHIIHIVAASALGFSFGVRARTEIWCVVGIHVLKVV